MKSILDRVAATESSAKGQPESWLVFLYRYCWGNLSFPCSVAHWLTFMLPEREGGECWFSFGNFLYRQQISNQKQVSCRDNCHCYCPAATCSERFLAYSPRGGWAL